MAFPGDAHSLTLLGSMACSIHAPWTWCHHVLRSALACVWGNMVKGYAPRLPHSLPHPGLCISNIHQGSHTAPSPEPRTPSPLADTCDSQTSNPQHGHPLGSLSPQLTPSFQRIQNCPINKCSRLVFPLKHLAWGCKIPKGEEASVGGRGPDGAKKAFA